MSNRRRITIGLVLVAAVGWFAGRGMLADSAPAPAHGDQAAAVGRAAPRQSPPSLPARAAGEDAVPATGGDAELIAYLRSTYGKDLDNSYVQIRMLERLMRYFQERYPDRWQELLLAAVREAFPEHYEQLAANLQRRLDYEAWMDENRARLRGLDAQARRDAIWEQRKQLFGDQADEIWASELKNQAVASALEAIDMQDGTGVADKLAMYRDSIEDVYQESADTYLQNHRQEAMNRFLDLSSVQQALGAMAPEERRQSLREIRTGMGMDEAALGRWDELDRTRDSRWESGAKYMQERAALAAQYQGADLEARLDALRARYFGAEAALIAEEEASGFFRFARERRWGRN